MALRCRAATEVPSSGDWRLFRGWAFGSGQFWGLGAGGLGRTCVVSGPSLCPGSVWPSLIPPLRLPRCFLAAMLSHSGLLWEPWVGWKCQRQPVLFGGGFILGSLGNEVEDVLEKNWVPSPLWAEHLVSATNSAAAAGMCGAPRGCADSFLHGYRIIWIFQLGTGSQGAGKDVTGLSSCHHAGTSLQGPRRGEAACSTRRARGVPGKLGTVETCCWGSLPAEIRVSL